MERKRPTLFHVLRTDFRFVYAFLQILVLGALALLLAGWIGAVEVAAKLTAPWLFLSVFGGAAGAFLRYRRIASVFEEGIEVYGLVAEISKSDRELWVHLVEFTYDFQAETYEEANMVWSPAAKHLVRQKIAGRPLTVVLDPNKPKTAFIKELYFR
jgi:hypothetical protein